jgi:hypothetical protein
MATSPSAISEVESGAKTPAEMFRDILHPNSAAAIASRCLATIGGGIALGWQIARLTGSIVGGAIGLLAILLSEKKR